MFYKTIIPYHECLEWVYFQNVGNEKYMGHPVKTPIVCCQEYDSGTLDSWGFGYEPWGLGPGPHMICDKDGNGLKWNDVKTDMTVKIRAKPLTTSYSGWDWLYASPKGN